MRFFPPLSFTMADARRLVTRASRRPLNHRGAALTPVLLPALLVGLLLAMTLACGSSNGGSGVDDTTGNTPVNGGNGEGGATEGDGDPEGDVGGDIGDDTGDDTGSDAEGDTGEDNGENQVWTRPEINSLDPNGPEIAALREGVRVMKQRDPADPTSWIYQANIHGVAASAGEAPAWRTCQHRSFYFLSWHRIYLYYFERILRDASGDDSLALPFWDYERGNASRALPLPLRQPASADNPLFETQRRQGINAGALIPESWIDSSETLLKPDFTAFPPGDSSRDFFGGAFMAQPAHFGIGSGALELQPHNNVHNAVGGLMSDPDTAARDIVFWLHHCNIDRLWEAWLQDPEHQNPIDDPVWLDTEFTFFDETAAQVVLTGREILDTASQLSYRYPDLEPGQGGSADDGGDPVPETPTHQPPSEPQIIAESEEDEYRLAAAPLSVAVEFTNLETPFDATALELVIEGLEISQGGEVYQVYLNLPADEEPSPDSLHFVGNLSLFGHAGHGPPENRVYDVGELAQRLEASGAFVDGLEVTIIRGTLEAPPGAEPILEAPVSNATRITFERVSLRVKP
ncbi:MAG: tyrosinase family protein [Acidobacteriota bacterium]